MKILVQFATTQPQDWLEIDLTTTGPGSRRWRDLPKKAVPTSQSVLDNEPGWLFSAMVQGVDLFGFDHVAVEPIAGNGLRVYGWVDDVNDTTFQYRWGEVWEFRVGFVDRTLGNLRHRGPDQRKTLYAENVADLSRYAPVECGGLPVAVRPWSEWVMPANQITMHGIWVRDEALFNQHFVVRRKASWQEWVT